LALGDAKNALPHLHRAVELAPDRATSLSNLCYAEQLSGDVEGALHTCQDATAKDPKLGSAWLNLGTALVKKGRYDDAQRAFEKAAALDPEDPRPRHNLDDLAELRKTGGGRER
jgi:Flp pilus assembly protein TadD